MSNIEKIRQEVERLKTTNPSEYNYRNAEGYIWAMNDLLAFIDSLTEEKPSEDLEEAAEKYADKHGFRVPYDGSNNYYDEVDVKASKDGFIAGAEWQKMEAGRGYDSRDLYEAYEQGRFEQKEQMMKDAADGEIVKDISNMLAVTARNIHLDGFKFGDKVKIIIVKQ